MTDGAQRTGTRDEHYNLVSVLFHCLEGADTYDQYIRDAKEAGDQELARFFQQVQRDFRKRADQAKQLLTQRLSASGA